MSPKEKAGIGVVVVGLVIGGVVFANRGGVEDSGACQVTSAGIGLLATRLREGSSATSIALGTGVGIAGSLACTQFVRRLDAGSGDQTKVQLQTADGRLVTLQVDRSSLTATAPVAQRRDIRRSLACIRSFSVPLLQNACIDGHLEPSK